MLVNKDSSFISYTLTEDEARTGSKFNHEQKAVIQNLIAAAAEDKVNLTFNPENPLQFAQREAELAGQIGILKYLLDLENQSKPLEILE